MSCRIIPLNQRPINNSNYKNNIIPTGNKKLYDINENIFNIEKSQNILNNFNTKDINQSPNQNIISSKKDIMEQDENIKSKYNNYNYPKLIQDLQYSNALLNKKNLELESELELIKNKYSSTKNDINDINKHISICKENQDKIINDLIERNKYLENIYSKNSNNKENNKNNEIKNKEIINNKNNINLHLFIYKMKKIFCNVFELDETNKDEDNLNIITNNIIRISDELNIYKKELEMKNFELNKLKKVNQILKIKLNQMNNHNNRQFLNMPNNNALKYYTSSIGNRGFISNIERKPLVDNISNYDFKDNFSNYSNSQIKIPKISGKYKSHSPSPLRNNIINNISKSPNAGDFKMNSFNTEKFLNNKIPFDLRKYGIKEKKLTNSRSIGQLKFNMLNEFENNKNNNYQYPKATLFNKQCENSKNSLQNLMNNVSQLENALNEAQTNIDINSLDNNQLS